MKSFSAFVFGVTLVSLFLFSAAPVSFAQQAATQPQTPAAEPSGILNYTPLAPLPGIGGTSTTGQAPNTSVDIVSYAQGVFRFAIGLAAALAVIMITIGGFEYIGSDVITSKEEGRKKITQALQGLFLVMGAWLILYTINPELVKLRFVVPELPAISTPAPELADPTVYKIQTCLLNRERGEESRLYSIHFTHTERTLEESLEKCRTATPRPGFVDGPSGSGCVQTQFSCQRFIPTGYTRGEPRALTKNYYVVFTSRNTSNNEITVYNYGPLPKEQCDSRAAEGLATHTPAPGTVIVSIECIQK